MGLEANARRRWFGALMLGAALAMLIAGETWLKGRLRQVGFLLYWMLCFVFTAAAIVVAFLDARAIQRRTRHEARELLQNTLGKIETEVRQKPRQKAPEAKD